MRTRPPMTALPPPPPKPPAPVLEAPPPPKKKRTPLIAYIPKEKIMFQGDFSLPAAGQPGNDHVKALVPILEKLKLLKLLYQ